MTQTTEVVDDLAFLILNLFGIGNHLPFASAALAKVGAEGLDTQGR